MDSSRKKQTHEKLGVFVNDEGKALSSARMADLKDRLLNMLGIIGKEPIFLPDKTKAELVVSVYSAKKPELFSPRKQQQDIVEICAISHENASSKGLEVIMEQALIWDHDLLYVKGPALVTKTLALRSGNEPFHHHDADDDERNWADVVVRISEEDDNSKNKIKFHMGHHHCVIFSLFPGSEGEWERLGSHAFENKALKLRMYADEGGYPENNLERCHVVAVNQSTLHGATEAQKIISRTLIVTDDKVSPRFVSEVLPRLPVRILLLADKLNTDRWTQRATEIAAISAGSKDPEYSDLHDLHEGQVLRGPFQFTPQWQREFTELTGARYETSSETVELLKLKAVVTQYPHRSRERFRLNEETDTESKNGWVSRCYNTANKCVAEVIHQEGGGEENISPLEMALRMCYDNKKKNVHAHLDNAMKKGLRRFVIFRVSGDFQKRDVYIRMMETFVETFDLYDTYPYHREKEDLEEEQEQEEQEDDEEIMDYTRWEWILADSESDFERCMKQYNDKTSFVIHLDPFSVFDMKNVDMVLKRHRAHALKFKGTYITLIPEAWLSIVCKPSDHIEEEKVKSILQLQNILTYKHLYTHPEYDNNTSDEEEDDDDEIAELVQQKMSLQDKEKRDHERLQALLDELFEVCQNLNEWYFK